MRLMPESWENDPVKKWLGYILLLLSGPAGWVLALIIELTPKNATKNAAPPMIPQRDKHEFGQV
jgi:hypothetical protein